MNFFDQSCQEPVITDPIFGICDGHNGAKAFTDREKPETWIATVKNDGKLGLTFTAVDNCVIEGNREPNRGRCDGMLTSSEHLFFVELKNQKEKWREHAIAQLESTIMFFLDNHDASAFKHKKAFACNKKHSRFQTVDNELSKYFFTRYKFRIDIQSVILVV